MENASDAIVLRDVVTSLEGRRVLNGVSLAAPAGRVTVLMGPSGVGKTISVKHILGLIEPDRGEVLVEGRPLAVMADGELLETRRRFGVMLQGATPFDCGLFSSATIYENVMFALRQSSRAAPEHHDDLAREWLDAVGLGGNAERLPIELSAGMRKRAALARALAPEAPIVVLDELEGGLDPVRLSLTCDLLLRVQQERGCTVFVTTHSTAVAARLADVLAVMLQGRIVARGRPQDLLSPDDLLWRRDDRRAVAFLRGEREALDGEVGQLSEELVAGQEGGRRSPTIIVLSAVLVALAVLILYLLIPVLHGDVSLNPYTQ